MVDNTSDGGVNLTPLYMSTIAGMSTCLGAVWVLFQRQPTKRRNQQSAEPVIKPSTMCFSLALAGSVMVTVSVVSIVPECLRDEDSEGGPYRMIPLFSITAFFRICFHIFGYVLYFLLAKYAFPEPNEILGLHHKQGSELDFELGSDLLLEETCSQDPQVKTDGSSSPTSNTNNIPPSPARPSARNRRVDKGHPSPTAGSGTEESSASGSPLSKQKPDFNFRTLSQYTAGADLESTESKRAWRVAMLLWLSLTVHNFPEGLAVAASAMESHALGVKVCIGIMVHNIPEGISIAVPCMAARPDSPWLAFWLSALSGLAEPFGAFVALFALRDIDSRRREGLSAMIFNMENVLAFVAGIMIMVAAAELYPEAMRHSHHGKTPLITGTVAGVLLMLATELYLE